MAQSTRWFAEHSCGGPLGAPLDLDAEFTLSDTPFDPCITERCRMTSGSTVSTRSGKGSAMTSPRDQLVNLANQYVAGAASLESLDELVHLYVDDFLALDKSDDAAAGLDGFIQVRVYQHRDGACPEQELRQELRDYLAEHGLLTSAAHRAAG